MIRNEDNSQSCISWACGPSVAAGLLLAVTAAQVVRLMRRTQR